MFEIWGKGREGIYDLRMTIYEFLKFGTAFICWQNLRLDIFYQLFLG